MSPGPDSDDWLVPDWPVPPGVRAVCTTRNGGVSHGVYRSLNLGVHVGDQPELVQENRQHLQNRLSGLGGNGASTRPVFLNQVHGTRIVSLEATSPDGVQADGAVTGALNVACTVMVADCLPVLLCNADGTRIAAAHAGWRGLAGQGGHGVLEAAIHALYGEGRSPLPRYHPGTLAWLGPCIGPTVFEVGDEVREAFMASRPSAQEFFTLSGPGKWLADLPALARQRLKDLGVEQIYGNDGSAAWCTVSNPLRFFSHRRDRVSGRMAACIWRIG